MMKLIGVIVVGLAMLTVSMAFAHEGHDHDGALSVRGTVETLEGSKLTLKGTDGKHVNVHVDDRTKYDNGGTAGASADLIPGMRVVVHGARMNDGTVHAEKIRYTKRSSSGPPSKGTQRSQGTRINQEHEHDHAK